MTSLAPTSPTPTTAWRRPGGPPAGGTHQPAGRGTRSPGRRQSRPSPRPTPGGSPRWRLRRKAGRCPRAARRSPGDGGGRVLSTARPSPGQPGPGPRSWQRRTPAPPSAPTTQSLAARPGRTCQKPQSDHGGGRPRGPQSQDQGAHRGVELGHPQAAQHVPFVTDGPEGDAVPAPVGARALGDDGHVPEGDGGHLQPRPAGHQLALSAGRRQHSPGHPGLLPARVTCPPLSEAAAKSPFSPRHPRWGPGEARTTPTPAPGGAPARSQAFWTARPTDRQRLTRRFSFLVFVPESTLFRSQRGRAPAGTSWADIYLDSFPLPSAAPSFSWD